MMVQAVPLCDPTLSPRAFDLLTAQSCHGAAAAVSAARSSGAKVRAPRRPRPSKAKAATAQTVAVADASIDVAVAATAAACATAATQATQDATPACTQAQEQEAAPPAAAPKTNARSRRSPASAGSSSTDAKAATAKGKPRGRAAAAAAAHAAAAAAAAAADADQGQHTGVLAPYFDSVTAHGGSNVPYELREASERVVQTTLQRAATDREVLAALVARLRTALDAVAQPQLPENLRYVADLQRKLVQATNALRHMDETATLGALVETSIRPHVARFRELERQAVARRRQEAARAARSETRFLPALPVEAPLPATTTSGTSSGASASASASATASNAVSTGGLPLPVPAVSAVPAASSAVAVAAISSSASPACAAAGGCNNALVVAREMLYKHGLERRPVDLVPFDTCPKCHIAMQYNQPSQMLVCPTPHCGHWKRFADMTSAALAFGDEVEFTKYTYRPVSHLDDTMKFAEGTEASVVPAETLERVMRALRRARVPPNRLSISLVRTVLSAQKAGVENTVQIFSRLTGIAPRRMTAFMKDQMRIMFNTQEEPFRRHCRARVNNLSFPYTLYKYCELLGYWEMLEALPLLRGVVNLGVHDAIYSRVCQDLGWQFIPTVGTGSAGPLIANTNMTMRATATAIAQGRPDAPPTLPALLGPEPEPASVPASASVPVPVPVPVPDPATVSAAACRVSEVLEADAGAMFAVMHAMGAG